MTRILPIAFHYQPKEHFSMQSGLVRSEVIGILLGSNGPTRADVLGRRHTDTRAPCKWSGDGSTRSWGADKSGVSDVDRVLGACVSCDRAALHVLTDKPDPATLLRIVTNQMLVWAIRTGRDCACPPAGGWPSIPTSRYGRRNSLHLAVRAGAVETVDLLIRAGAAMDEGNSSRRPTRDRTGEGR